MGRALDYSVCGRVDQRSDSMDNRVCLPETPHFKEREKKIVFYFYFHSVCVKSLDQFSLNTIQKKIRFLDTLCNKQHVEILSASLLENENS